MRICRICDSDRWSRSKCAASRKRPSSRRHRSDACEYYLCNILPGVELPNNPPDGAGADWPHKEDDAAVLLAAPAVDEWPPRPRGGGFVGAGVEAAGGVEGTTPPPPPNSPPPPPPNVVVDDDDEAAAAVPAPKTVVVLFPQVTTMIAAYSDNV